MEFPSTLATARPWVLPRTVWIFVGLVVMDAALLLLHGVHAAFPARSETTFLDLDSEASLASWFSSAQYLTAGVLMLSAAALATSDLVVRRRLLLVLGGGLVFLSMDEGALFHERLGEAIGRWELLGWIPGGESGWVFLYGVAAVLLAILLRRDLLAAARRLPIASAVLAAGFASIFVGAIAIDTFAGAEVETGKEVHSRGYELEVSAEEGLELLGVSLLVLGALCVGDRCRQAGSSPDGGLEA